MLLLFGGKSNEIQRNPKYSRLEQSRARQTVSPLRQPSSVDFGWTSVEFGGLRLEFGGVRWISVEFGGLRWSSVELNSTSVELNSTSVELNSTELQPKSTELHRSPTEVHRTPPKSNQNPPNWVVGGVTLFGELVIVPDESILDFVGFAAKEK